MGNAGVLRNAGNQHTQDPRLFFQNDLPKFIVDRRIGNGKFMKTYIVKVDGVPLVVKVYMKLQDEDLQSVALELSNLWKTISPTRYPNLLPYQIWIKSSLRVPRTNANPVYLIRQFIHANLHDRLSTRPFLAEVEKLWLLYQLFKGIEVCHMSHGIIHGDIKPENVMVTTWNWLVLTDFGTFKPANLPDDDPTDFQYYFDTTGRGSCYLAPERFFRRDVKPTLNQTNRDMMNDSTPAMPQLTSAIDVFSLGCTIAEVFLDGDTFIDLPGMLKYVGASGGKAGGGQQQTKQFNQAMERLDENDSPCRGLISRIRNKLVRDVVVDMTQRDPTRRTNVRNYRHILEGRRSAATMVTQGGSTTARSNESSAPKRVPGEQLPFPEYFAQTIYPLFQKLHTQGVTPDDRILIMCENYDELLQSMTGRVDLEGSAFFKFAMKLIMGAKASSSASRVTTQQQQQQQQTKDDIPEHLRPFSSNVIASARVRPNNGSMPRLLSTRFSSEQEAQQQQPHRYMPSRINSSHNKPVETINDSTSLSGASWGANEFMEMPIDELMEKCEELIKNIDKNRPVPITAASMGNISSPTQSFGKSQPQQPMSPGVIKDSRRGSRKFLSPQALNGKALMNVALQSSYGIDSILHSSKNMTPQATINFLNLQALTNQGGDPANRAVYEGLLLPIQVVCSCFRNVKHPHTKIVSILLLIRLGSQCADDVILHRIVPILLHAVEDSVPQVRATAIRALRALLVCVQRVDAIESNIFPQYIFPALNNLMAKDQEITVRVALAESLGLFAETAKRFLEQAHLAALNKAMAGEDRDNTSTNGNDDASVRIKDTTPVVNFNYDKRLKALHEQISRWIKELLQENVANRAVPRPLPKKSSVRIQQQAFYEEKNSYTSIVKRVLLVDIVRLCAFFGHEDMDTLLQPLLTFLNDHDWEVRYAFCAKIASVCAFVGSTITIDRILPCLELALVDVEERVILRAIQCLTSLIQLGLLSHRSVVINTVKAMIPMTLHPCASIRDAGINLCAAAYLHFGATDAMVFLLPLLKPVLQFDITGCDIDINVINVALLPPISRISFRYALKERLRVFPTVVAFEGVLNGGNSNNNSGKEGILSPSATPDSKNRKVSMNPVKQRLLDQQQQDSGSVGGADELAQDSSMIDPADISKIQILKNYLDSVAKEIAAKARTMNNMDESKGISQRSMPYETSLERLAMTISECSTESLLIPHQKHGSMFFATFTSEQARRHVTSNPSAVRNGNKLRAYYGIQTIETAKKALSLGYNEQAELDTSDILGAKAGGGRDNRKQSQVGPARGGVNVANEPIDTSTNDVRTLIKQIKALGIAPMPPDLGALVQADSRSNDYMEPDPTSRTAWRPRENTLVATLREHTDGVNQLAISPDQTFFCSASSDQTVKVWRVKGVDKFAVPRSVFTYKKHQGAVTSAVILENSHSVASCSEDGSVHVWRVDYISDAGNNGSAPNGSQSGLSHGSGFSSNNNNNVNSGLSLGGDMTEGSKYASTSTSEIKQLHANEGAVVAVNHYNSDVASVVTYITQNSGIHGWDLRSVKESFHYTLRPELGQPTSMAMAPDRSWMCVGTSRGYVSLWDIRYNVMCKLWRHSSKGPIHRLATCKPLRVTAQMQQAAYQSKSEYIIGSSEGSYLFVAAGNNEAAVWGIPEGGECLKCFRSIPLRSSRQPLAPLPSLVDIPLNRHPYAPILGAFESSSFNNLPISGNYNPLENAYRAVLGRISDKGISYLVTAGTDKVIRYWDFASPYKCFTVTGLLPCQPRPTFETPSMDGMNGKLFLSYDAAVPTAETVTQTHLPVRESRGPVQSSTNFKDAVLDLKSIDVPLRLMLSASRDGEIKMWR